VVNAYSALSDDVTYSILSLPIVGLVLIGPLVL
jgi:hypothetical protein